MKEEHGFELPRRLQVEFSKTIQTITENTGTEISPAAMWDAFLAEYLPDEPRLNLVGHELHTSTRDDHGRTKLETTLSVDGHEVSLTGEGDGPVEAFVHALTAHFGDVFDVVDYTEHAIGRGADARAVAYVETSSGSGELRWGVGVDSNITTASLIAVLRAFERQHRR